MTQRNGTAEAVPFVDLIFILRCRRFVLRGFGRCFLGKGGGARDGRVFFHVAGDDPFGQFLRVVGVGVGDDGVQHMQGDAGVVDGFANAGGGSGLFALARSLALDGGFKVVNVLVEVGNEGIRELEAAGVEKPAAGVV